MSIEQVFGVRKVLLPVIHPKTYEDAQRSVEKAVRAGVPGVFVINQGLDRFRTRDLGLWVRSTFPTTWVGINVLGLSPTAALGFTEGLNGLWADDAQIDEEDEAQPYAARFVTARRERGWAGLFFGGVAFKYRREVPPSMYGVAAKKAAPYVDVIVTSGAGTGIAAPVDKLSAMREAVGTHSIALASGVTFDNVTSYLPYVDAFLVGTSIESELGVLDEERTRALHERIAGF